MAGGRVLHKMISLTTNINKRTSMKIKLFKFQAVGLLCAAALVACAVSTAAAETNAVTPKPAAPESNTKTGAQKAATAAAQAWLGLVDDGTYAPSWDQD